jgi:hypothetical protein
MNSDECEFVLRDTVNRLAKEFNISNSGDELHLFACSVCIEASLSTWIVMWEDGTLSKSELRNFFDRNFRGCLNYWVKTSRALSDRINKSYSKLVSQLHLLVLRIADDDSQEKDFDRSVIHALLASMVARQIFDQGVLLDTCVGKQFANFSPSIHSSFFRRCLARSHFDLRSNICMLEVSSLLLDNRGD